MSIASRFVLLYTKEITDMAAKMTTIDDKLSEGSITDITSDAMELSFDILLFAGAMTVAISFLLLLLAFSSENTTAMLKAISGMAVGVLLTGVKTTINIITQQDILNPSVSTGARVYFISDQICIAIRYICYLMIPILLVLMFLSVMRQDEYQKHKAIISVVVASGVLSLTNVLPTIIQWTVDYTSVSGDAFYARVDPMIYLRNELCYAIVDVAFYGGLILIVYNVADILINMQITENAWHKPLVAIVIGIVLVTLIKPIFTEFNLIDKSYNRGTSLIYDSSQTVRDPDIDPERKHGYVLKDILDEEEK